MQPGQRLSKERPEEEHCLVYKDHSFLGRRGRTHAAVWAASRSGGRIPGTGGTVSGQRTAIYGVSLLR